MLDGIQNPHGNGVLLRGHVPAHCNLPTVRLPPLANVPAHRTRWMNAFTAMRPFAKLVWSVVSS